MKINYSQIFKLLTKLVFHYLDTGSDLLLLITLVYRTEDT